MILQRFYLACLAHASYIVADERTGKAAVVDPQRDVEQYLAFAAEKKLSIEHVVLTHFHADFVSGHLELQKRTGAEIYLGATAKAEYAFTKLADGAVVSLGEVSLRALETPGHTPEAICVLVEDKGKPHAVLTGDTLFIGDVGRPDLMASVGVTAKELAGKLYDSLHKRLLALPDDVLVYPAHGAGSLCGKSLSSEPCSSLGQQKKFNYALQPMTKAAFVKLVTTDQPEAPAYFGYDAGLNRRKHPMLGAKPLARLTLKQVSAKKKAGAQVLDTRDPADFARGHLPGSVNVGLGGKYATFAGMVLDPKKSIVLVCEPGREQESAVRLGRIGFDAALAGWLPASELEKTAVLPRHTAPELARILAGKDKPALLDVRTPGERAQNKIPGSVHIPLQQLPRRLKEVPKGESLVVYCAGGYRSAIAASLIMAAGRTGVSDLEGGMGAWLEAQEAAKA